MAVLKSTDVPAWRPALEALAPRGARPHRHRIRPRAASAPRPSGCVGTLKGKQSILVALGPLAAQAAKELAAGPTARLLHGPGPREARGSSTRRTSTGVAFSIPVKNQLAAFRDGVPARRRASASSTRTNGGPPGAGGAEGGERRAAGARGAARDLRARDPAGAAHAAAGRRRRWTRSGCRPIPCCSPTRPALPARGDAQGGEARLQLLRRPRARRGRS